MPQRARLNLLDSQPHTSLLLLLLIIMIYGYSIHVPCRPPNMSELATFLHPLSPWSDSARCALQQTLHPDPDNCSNIYFLFEACDNPWRSVESTVAQHYHYTDQH